MARIDPLDHAVSRYAIDVIEGRVIAGKLVQLACERHLRDLEDAEDRGLWFDPGAASMIIRFAKTLQHTAGPMAGKPLALEPWQAFRMGSVFGWKHRETGLRRFRSTYHQVGKKNGKTTDTAVPMIYTQLFDGEASPEAYCAATTRDQAGLLFRGIKKIIKRNPFLSAYMDAGLHQIETSQTDGLIKTLSRDGNSSDGINPSFIARDEMHRWTDRELAETITESMIARAQPIDWVITTAGHDIGSLCGELRTYSESVLRGDVQDDQHFAFVAEPDPDCDPADPIAWAMGNPNLDVSKPSSAMQNAVARAQVMPAQMPNFKRFHLNLWTEGAESWVRRDDWDGGPEGKSKQPWGDYYWPEQFRGAKAWVALDLSEKIDTTSIAIAIPRDGLIHVISHVYLPAGNKGFIARAQAEKKEYIGWRDMGWLKVVNGPALDDATVIEELVRIRDFFDVQEVAYDPWHAKYIADDLDKKRFPMLEHRQGYASMSNPMKAVEERILKGTLRHAGNPVLAWQVGNVARDEDARGNIAPNKKKSTGRIDAAVAMIMAVGRAEAGENKRKKTAREIGST